MHAVVDVVAQYLIFVLLAVAAVAGLTLPRNDRWRLIFQAVIAIAVLGVLVQIANHAYHDTRPFVLHHTRPWFSHPADNGFPSDHTTVAALAAFLLWPYRRLTAVALFVGAVAVGTARVVAGVHSPTDIIGAVIIAGLAALAGGYAGRAAYGYWTRRRSGGAGDDRTAQPAHTPSRTPSHARSSN